MEWEEQGKGMSGCLTRHERGGKPALGHA
jgi:hypothetical protein